MPLASGQHPEQGHWDTARWSDTEGPLLLGCLVPTDAARRVREDLGSSLQPQRCLALGPFWAPGGCDPVPPIVVSLGPHAAPPGAGACGSLISQACSSLAYAPPGPLDGPGVSPVALRLRAMMHASYLSPGPQPPHVMLQCRGDHGCPLFPHHALQTPGPPEPSQRPLCSLQGRSAACHPPPGPGGTWALERWEVAGSEGSLRGPAPWCQPGPSPSFAPTLSVGSARPTPGCFTPC